jgi:hypothetical protein
MALKRWSLLYVQPRLENRVAYELCERGVENFLPSLRRQNGMRTIELPLFPGYVFCRLAARDRSAVVFIGGVISIGCATPADVSQDVEDLKRIINSGFIYAPWPYTRTGTRAVIDEGPLDGLDGYLLDRNHVVLSLRSLCRSLVVETDLKCVEGTHPK